MRCENCGREIKDGAKFCPYCGTRTAVTKSEPKTEYRQGWKNEQGMPQEGARQRTAYDRRYDKNPSSYQKQTYKDPGKNTGNFSQSNTETQGNPNTTSNTYYVYQPEMSESQLPEKYKPISMWGYFGYELLFAIPFAGFIILIVFCFTATNQNLKNFARSYFCFLIIVLIIFAIVMAVAGSAIIGAGIMGL